MVVNNMIANCFTAEQRKLLEKCGSIDELIAMLPEGTQITEEQKQQLVKNLGGDAAICAVSDGAEIDDDDLENVAGGFDLNSIGLGFIYDLFCSLGLHDDVEDFHKDGYVYCTCSRCGKKSYKADGTIPASSLRMPDFSYIS